RSSPDAEPIEAIFFGGGTPSALTVAQIAHILTAIRDSFEVSADPEITVEWYPKDSDSAKFGALRQIGVERVSFGVQTWNPRTARSLGAHHSAEDADAVLALAKRTGFRGVNIDLMMN